MQIVVGLLAGPDGMPAAIRVFEGNTNDPKTVSAQIRILKEGFGVKEVPLIGDRGMLKGPQIKSLPDDFRYVTAITKPQIRKMLALLVQRELERLWAGFDITVEEGINELAAIHTQKIRLGKATVDNIPIPNELGIQLLKAAGITLPSVFPHKPVNVHTNKNLQSGRKRKRLQHLK
jgi:hypothetical protein